MSDEHITRRRLGDRRQGRTDWAAVDALTDEQIEAAIKGDPDAVPLLDDDFWANAELVLPEGPKDRITMYVDREVLEFFRSSGRGYQTRMNAVLRAYTRRYRRRAEKRRG